MGATKYHEFEPHETIRDDAKCLWVLEKEYPPDGFEDVTPDGCVELICNFGSPYLRPEPPHDPLPVGFIVGFQTRPVRFRVSGVVKIVAARLHPWGALALLNDRCGTHTNALAALGLDWDVALLDLGAFVSRGDDAGAAARLQAFLIERALSRRFDPGVVRAAARLLHTKQGQFRIEELADCCHVSARQLQRGFKDSMGTSPKMFARVQRFRAAQRVLMFDPRTDLARLSYQCGYADQAHFIRDFREFAGKTPGEYAREVDALREVLRSRDVVFLQSSDPRPG